MSQLITGNYVIKFERNTALLRPACLWLWLAAVQQTCPLLTTGFLGQRTVRVKALQLALTDDVCRTGPTYTRVRWFTRPAWPYRQSD